MRQLNLKGRGTATFRDLRYYTMPIVAKGHARVCLIRKCFLSKDTSTLVRAFTTYVRPLLEYCSSVWSPHLKRDINKIDSVQRKMHQKIKRPIKFYHILKDWLFSN